jgi:hypothetical protein
MTDDDKRLELTVIELTDLDRLDGVPEKIEVPSASLEYWGNVRELWQLDHGESAVVDGVDQEYSQSTMGRFREARYSYGSGVVEAPEGIDIPAGSMGDLNHVMDLYACYEIAGRSLGARDLMPLLIARRFAEQLKDESPKMAETYDQIDSVVRLAWNQVGVGSGAYDRFIEDR